MNHAFPKVFRIERVPGKIFVRAALMMAVEALGFSKPYVSEVDDV
jgi:hypothetical protein